MMHKANMGNRDLICSGYRVADRDMTEADRAWARGSSVIVIDGTGNWYHSQITDRDRAARASFWKPDTGHSPAGAF